MKVLIVVLVLAAGCTASSATDSEDAGRLADGGANADAGSTCALWDGGTPESCGVYCVTGAIPGVRLTVTSDRCMYRSGDAATFEYSIDVDGSAPVIHVTSASSGSPCGAVSSDPRSFIQVRVDPADGTTTPHYCDCDQGNCAARQPADVTLTTGSTTGTFAWPGRAWDGPSDTGNGFGDAFPPGDYVVSVAFISGGQGNVVARLPITITQ